MPAATASHDQFIGARLPAWLKRASRAQINTLRNSLNAHHASQARLRGLMHDLLPPPQFAEKRLTALLDAPLPDGVAFAQLEWLQVAPRFGRVPGTLIQIYEYSESRENGLQRLMRNFAAGTSYFKGTGLVLPGRDQPLTASLDAFIAACRELDVGRCYQDELRRVFSPATQAILAEDKRSGLKLAIEVAALQGDISAEVQVALREVVDHGQVHRPQGLKGAPRLLTMLGQPVADGLLIQLRDNSDVERGTVLYLPSDPQQALRHFETPAAMNNAIAQQLQKKAYRQYFTQLISLEQRASFLTLLGQRLRDERPDLQLASVPQEGSIFTQLATLQVQRVKDDARLLLVSSADADSLAVQARHAEWKTVGLDLANLAGFFIPVVGALLMGQLVVQVCSDVFEGVTDWARGHQHEALDHLLCVAETLAATAATVAAAGFLRSAFVEGLEPVSMGNGESRLWRYDPAQYRSMPDTIDLHEDGRFAVAERRWVRIDGHYLEVHKPVADGPYRLRHASVDGGYGPVVLHNGERGWRLLHQQPLTWEEPGAMLDVLWPQHPAIEAGQAEQVLQVAGVDLEELRGVLVENRRAPVNLGQTLRAFQAQARIETFFARARLNTLMPPDSELLAWCEGLPQVGKGLAKVLEHEAELRPQLFAQLTQQPFAEDPLTLLVRRDFPGLPSAYVKEVVGQASELERDMARIEQRLPLNCAHAARSLLRLARLNRALAGLYLSTGYSDETGELALALLDSLDLEDVAIDLREGGVDGRSIKLLGSAGQGQADRILVRSNGRFQLYNGLGEEQTVTLADPGCIFEAIFAALTPAQRPGIDSAEQLRERLLAQLPASHWGVTRMLGWPEQRSWFNPGRRLPDGRVGYPLSDHPAANPRDEQAITRDRLRALYPGLDEPALDEELARLQQGERPIFEQLVQLQDDHDQLVRQLNRWVASELQESRQAARRLGADSILRAWRLQGEVVAAGEGRAQGQRLSLTGTQLRTLPSLPPQIEFHRVTVLSLHDTLVQDIPVDFLRPFTALTELNLSGNQLLRLPLGIAYLPNVQVLRLAHNQIRLDAQAIEILHGLPNLVHLDLSYNRLEALDLRFHHFSRLTSLNLRHCRLGTWPQYLELCGSLERADLRDNQLRTVPDDIQLMPYAFRRAILTDRNPLSRMALQRLYALDVINEHGHSPETPWPVDLPRTLTLLTGDADAAEQRVRQALWQRLLEQPASSRLFKLLARLEFTADYLQAGQGRAALIEAVWQMLGALDADPVLCVRVFQRAGLSQYCSDAVASHFSALQVEVTQAQAVTQALNPENRSRLLELGRQLFRLERLEDIAYRDCRQRRSASQHVDEVALQLAYRVRLRIRLGLPSQPYAMRYPDAVELTDSSVEDAFQRVTHAQTLSALTNSLSQREFWRRYLQQRHGQMFDAITADYNQRSIQLQAERPALSPAEYAARLGLLHDQETAEIERLISGLTQSYLRAAERGEG
ncbi:NEL-type E3 ubiquitin ligase domain-containing protein [Pseudomonas sp. BCRC 81390]|uniref:NEL-type E3 ubiquitin ligase domain-containing protein n=1 Tax=Pseudomonas sp. BCRC 81390 TaxID=3054778 RepID=UPI00259A9A63|nr:NEL-type E3 ubiquitin ligase domain-containing protein [Pseudomonas sp. BCRC 81390]MDM3884729.1 NEL-type E3 ubiquitin ligase domain-containing protein [Pseudomonas sp. BCRC 81390]